MGREIYSRSLPSAKAAAVKEQSAPGRTDGRSDETRARHYFVLQGPCADGWGDESFRRNARSHCAKGRLNKGSSPLHPADPGRAHPALTFSLGIKVGVGADDYCRALESLTRDVHRRELLRTRSAMARSHNGGNFCKVDEKGYNP